MELPHRYPIALIDSHKIIDDHSIVATYEVQADHPVLEGHFPHVKIWPGVYLIEGMNQCAGIHALYLAEQDVGAVQHSDYVTFVTRVDGCKFRNPVFPRDVLTLNATLTKRKMNNIFYNCEVFCNEKRVASASIGLTAKKL